jgi:SRSO17 transposase
LLHFVGEGNWSDEKVLAKVREMVLPEMERHGPIEAWIIDDTGFPKKGRHSVGVARQYCGELGKQDNCQIAVTLSIANHHASLPAAYRLYLPKEWAADRTRRRKAGVPKEITFKTKPAIALEQLRWACAAGLPRGVSRGAPPLRPERHIPNSIATIRRRLSAALVATLSRCPCCIAPISPQNRRTF